MNNKTLTISEIRTLLEMAAKDLNCQVQELTINKLEPYISERQLKRNGGLPLLKSAYYPDDDKALVEIKKAKLEKNYINKLENKLSDKNLFEQTITSTIAKLAPIKIKSFKYNKKQKINRQISLVLSDLHFGSDIKSKETGKHDFGKVEESRRLARVIKEVLDYKPEYRNETSLNLLILGDVIENKLHDIQDAAPIAEQCARAIHLLTQAIAHCSENFPKVNVLFASGNHGRLTSRHPNRATNQKWDSIETIIYYAVKTSLKNVKNIKFDLPMTPYVTYSVFGKNILCTHGDSMLNVGYPGKTIQTGSIETQINKINAALPDVEEYSVVIVGHVHVSSVTHLNNGVVLITNGALVPVNEFAVSIGIMESAAGQMMFESIEGFPVGDCRYIRVSAKDDKDKSLDELIEPWKNL